MPQKTLKKKRWSNPFQTIKAKLLIFGLCISLIPISVITSIYYFNARSALKRQIIQDMTAIAESRRVHVLAFMDVEGGIVNMPSFHLNPTIKKD